MLYRQYIIYIYIRSALQKKGIRNESLNRGDLQISTTAISCIVTNSGADIRCFNHRESSLLSNIINANDYSPIDIIVMPLFVFRRQIAYDQ